METLLLVAAVVGVGWWLLRGGSSGGSTPNSTFPKVWKGDVVWLLGDSMAEGLKPHLEMLTSEAGVTLISTVKRGAPVSWGAAQASSPPPADVWLVCLGTNDAAVPSVGKLREHVQSILRRGEPRSIIWLIPPDGEGLLNWVEVTDIIREEVLGATVEPPMGMLEDKYASDGVHLTPAGYKVWAEQVWRTIHDQN